MPIDPDQVEAVFLAAAGCTELCQRATVLERECGNDAELRDRVEALLEVHDHPRPLPRFDLGRLSITGDQSPAYAPGTVIAGRYRLLEEIAEGGMGSVWVAQQTNPVHREVALKLIKPGMDSRRLLSRFESELQALALMEHPFIAQVFDGGVTEHGRPFFVMEYVHGVPVTKYCDEARFPISERLKLFLDICQAVQHAHQKGIIHRDLKPSNILVCQHADRAVPKVIDFGLAKAMHEPLTTQTLQTAPGLLMGTPRYMSPEQTEFKNADIDTRSDVYSLGAILYELLTGMAPLDSQRFEDASWTEMLRKIKEEEPLKPSSKLNHVGDLTTLATARNRGPAQLCRELRGDLDWIALKALEKDRSRRYQSVGELARDIERYLNHCGVEARPPSAAYRFQKFARRNRLLLTAVTLVSATLIIGTIISAALATRAIQATRLAEAARADEALHRKDADQRRIEADQAREAEAAQRKIAEDARNAAEKRRAQTETGFRDSRNAIDAYFTSLRANKVLNVPALQPLRQELLGSALGYYRQFVDQHGNDAGLEAEVANSYVRIGELSGIIGSKQEAIDAFEQAIQRYDNLADEHSEYWWDVAYAYQQLGRQQRDAGQLQDAEVSLTRALATWQRAAQQHPHDPDYQINISRAYVHLGNHQRLTEQFVDAEASFRRAFEIYEQLESEQQIPSKYRLYVAEAYHLFALLQRMTDRSAEAEASSRQAVQIYEQLAGENQTEPNYIAGIAGAAYQLGHLQRINGDFDAAKKSYARALQLYEAFSRDDTSEADYRRSIGGARFHLGLLESIAGREDEAMQSWTTALAEFAAAAELGYESPGFFAGQADTLAMLGRWREAADMLTKAVDSVDSNWRYRYQLALLHWAGGDKERYRAACNDLVARRAEQAAGAEASAIVLACLVDPKAVNNWNNVLAIAEQAAAADPSNPVYQSLVGAAQYRTGHIEQAQRTLEQSLPLLVAAETSSSPRLDPVRASRLLTETVLMLTYRERADEGGVARQARSVQDLVDRMQSTAPLYCDEGESWRIGFAILFAQRELARHETPTEP